MSSSSGSPPPLMAVRKENTTAPKGIGMIAETKNLYRQGDGYPWQDQPPEIVKARPTATSAKFALIVRHEMKLGDTDGFTLGLHSITVQSPLIKKQLGRVFSGYQGINTNLKNLVFSAPFHEFFYRWEEFLRAEPNKSKGESGVVANAHYHLLSSIISAEIRPHIEQASDLLKNNVISFDYVWALFYPGTEVYAKVDGHDRLFILVGGSYNGRSYDLSCRYVDVDGSAFGYATTTFTIGNFDGVKAISGLCVVPSCLQPDMAEIRERLARRGRIFESLKGLHHRAYSGAYERIRPPRGTPSKQVVNNAKVIIDCHSFLKYNDEAKLSPLNKPPQPKIVDAEEKKGMDMYSMDPGFQTMSWSSVSTSEPETAAGQHLFEDHYPLCTHIVRGFCLKTKEWGYLDIDMVNSISWNSAAFDQLVLPLNYKRLIKAFVDAQVSELDDFDDVIEGKGKGIIMLLSGDPGTGKTLTSESVAENMQKPLYSMSASELGDDARDVEQNLERVLELSTRWGVVLLLDECDVFLEQRSLHDLRRNKLVSIFLRLLEYYQGVMFLTTNRVQAFDRAFESRIHLTINYPNLGLEGRFHVWKSFVRHSPHGDGVTEDELAQLSCVELNGRQIKNVVKTARLLAASEKIPLAFDHVKTVLHIKGKDVNTFCLVRGGLVDAKRVVDRLTKVD